MVIECHINTVKELTYMDKYVKLIWILSWFEHNRNGPLSFLHYQTNIIKIIKHACQTFITHFSKTHKQESIWKYNSVVVELTKKAEN